jgi:phenylalanyl-tRNA synthetase alpha chain
MGRGQSKKTLSGATERGKAKTKIERITMPHSITQDQLNQALNLRDLTNSDEGSHAMQLLLSSITDKLTSNWNNTGIEYRGSKVVTIANNYDNLGYPLEGAARDARYTRYVDDQHLLRTQMSAVIPTALKEIGKSSSDILISCPGLVWRRDVVDRIHVGEPHQLDLWRITDKELTEEDLNEMVALVVGEVLPGATYRMNPASHPYTLHGKEVEVLVNDQWIELLECGMAHPDVLHKAGLHNRTGLAMGMGLDRAIMLRKGIDDIRLLRSTDERVQTQMLDLKAYESVSDQPAARRDITIAVDPDLQDEEIGDQIRELLGEEAEWVEEVTVLSRTPAKELPLKACKRLGIASNQDNILLSIILRHPTRSLVKHEANVLRDKIYGKLHQGTVHDWIIPPSQ